MSKNAPHVPETRGRKNAPYIQGLINAIENGDTIYVVDKSNVNSARVCICRNPKIKQALAETNRWKTTRIIDGKLKIFIMDNSPALDTEEPTHAH